MSKSADTVTIVSKLPFPLIMELQTPFKVNAEVFGGGTREEIRHSKNGQRVTIKGCAYDRGAPVRKEIIGGAALTHGVDREFAEQWFTQNQGNPIVMKGLVWAANTKADAASQAKEMRKELSGFEPVDPASVPAEFKGQIETEKTADSDED